MSDITVERVKHIANLAKIHIEDHELERYSKQLTSVMALINNINDIEVDESIQPFVHVKEEISTLRSDDIYTQLLAQDVLRNAPEQSDLYFKVPKVL